MIISNIAKGRTTKSCRVEDFSAASTDEILDEVLTRLGETRFSIFGHRMTFGETSATIFVEVYTD